MNTARGGATAWASPSNAVSSNNSYATCAAIASYADYLDVSNFGFSIPAGATLNGYTVEIEMKASVALPTEMVANLRSAGADVGSSKLGNAPTTEAYVTFGGASDKWGTALTVSNVNASTFEVRLTSNFGIDTVTVDVDHIRVTVHYTLPGMLPSKISRVAVNRASYH